jgi:hypothetical protein
MALHRKHRLLVVGDQSYMWRVRHQHVDGCEEVLRLRRVGSPSARALGFRSRPGFSVPDGGTSAAGVVGDDHGRWLNLNEPGVVRAFVDALGAADWPAGDLRSHDLDGWAWFAAAHDRRHGEDR